MNLPIVLFGIFNELGDFLSQLFSSISSGILFFGGPIDLVLNLIDILVTALLIYYVLQLMADTRAWQLLRGIILILLLTLVCDLFGLVTMSYILNNSISILAIAFVVVFQPELRRALETVGRNTLHILPGRLGSDEEVSSGSIHRMIEAIVVAAERMAATYTGALMVIERSTRLGELLTQENVVMLDSSISATALMQIFYKGSPLHDGAVLIRDGRIHAARCHVPLSDNYHLRKDHGTRHRAAVGVSEMGDAVAVVVSEERGTISVALDGRLYALDNADALRTLLHKLLAAPEKSTGFWSGVLGRTRRFGPDGRETEQDATARPRFSKKRTRLLRVSSFLIALFVWLFVQTTTNPVETRDYSVQLDVRGVSELQEQGLAVQYPISTISLSVRGRANSFSSLSARDLSAYVDLAGISEAAVTSVPIQAEVRSISYFEVLNVRPDRQDIVVYQPEAP